MNDRIYQLVVEQTDISWKSIIYDLIQSEQMDAWDVDIALLTQKYIARIQELKQSDLKLSGKVLLCCAMLLKLKSKRLVGEDLDSFDRLLAGQQDSEEEFYEGVENDLQQKPQELIPELQPHLPLPRQRKVSVYDLVRALEKALEVKRRRVLRNAPPPAMNVPVHKFDLTKAVNDLFLRILGLFGAGQTLTFSSLLQSTAKRDKIYTFIPLLHLANQGKISLEQKTHFGEISVEVRESSEIAQSESAPSASVESNEN
ncbi:MAG: ScpA family protein [Candidatus Woesearchaeota archaeon]|nr:ScpA family protein [Candidatus Woesearchaeota archaeon]